MKTILGFSCLLFLTTVAVTASYGDIARPKTSPTREGKVVLHTGLLIAPDAKLYEARLQIRQSELQNLRAALDGVQTGPTLAASVVHSPTRTIIAGFLLFLSVSFAGVWLARSFRAEAKLGRGQKLVAIVVLTAATLGAAAIITRGNAGPPGYYRWKNISQNLAQGRETSGGLDIEIVPDDPNAGGGMKLLIPLRNQNRPGEDE
jgi:hypothetical protein